MSRKPVIFAGMFLALAITYLPASESRLISLCNPSGFIKDNTDIFYYPGMINQYHNRIDLELRTESYSENWSIGSSLQIGKSILGVYLNQPTGFNIDQYLYYNNMEFQHDNYSPGDLDLSKKIQFIYGFGGKSAIGLSLAIDGKSVPEESNNSETIIMNAQYLELTGGICVNKGDIGFSVFTPLAKVKNEQTDEETNLSGIGFKFNGRYLIYERPETSVTTLCNLYYTSVSNELHKSFANLADNYDNITAELGVGIDYIILENTRLILSLYPVKFDTFYEIYPNILDISDNDEYYTRLITIPDCRFAVECQLTPWLLGRFGASQFFQFYSETIKGLGNNEVQNKEFNSTFNAELGFGIKFKRFYLDGVLNNELLFDGPNVIGGKNPGMSSQLSLGYVF